MPLTLFTKGKLIAHAHSPPQEELDQHVPLDYLMDWFEDKIGVPGKSPADRILVLRASTGSGKSTVFPPEFYHRYYEKTGRRNIACTQPRVLTSKDLPRQILEFNTREFLNSIGKGNRTPFELGVNIGYQTGDEKKKAKGLNYMTVTSLQMQLASMDYERFSNLYSLLIVDETHERSLGTDFVIADLKRLIYQNYKKPECPFLVVTSATFDPFKFADYLLQELPADQRYKNIIEIAGFGFEIKDHFSSIGVENYITASVDKVLEIHTKNAHDFLPPEQVFNNDYKESTILKEDAIADITSKQIFRDMLVFATGKSDCDEIIQRISKLNKSNDFCKKYPLCGVRVIRDDISGESIYKRFFYMSYRDLPSSNGVSPVRKIFVANVVAETGLTIDTLKYVIDAGYSKVMEYDPVYRTKTLFVRTITEGQWRQRRGRVGRKAPGEAHFLYTEETKNLLQKDQFPDIIKEDTILIILRMIITSVDIEQKVLKNPMFELLEFEKENLDKPFNVQNMDLLDVPSSDSLHSSAERLFHLGAITSSFTPTVIGILIYKLDIPPNLAKMILSGYAWKTSISDLITIAVCMMDNSGFTDMFKFQAIKYGKLVTAGKVLPAWCKNSHEFLLRTSCDFITALFIWERFQSHAGKTINITRVNGGFDKKTNSGKSKSNTKQVQQKKPLFTKEEPPEFLKVVTTACEDWGLKLDFFMDKVKARDTLLKKIADAGLNPYFEYENGFRFQDKYSYDEYVKKIKLCIFEGFKSNLAVWDSVNKVYRTKIGKLEFSPYRTWLSRRGDINTYEIDNPKYLVYSDFSYRHDANTNKYNSEIGYCSAMDGNVNIDLYFDKL